MFQRLATRVLMAAALAVSAGAQTNPACTETTALTTRVEFAEMARARRILSHRDPFARQLSAFDLGARQRTTNPTTVQDFLAFAADQGEAWTPSQVTLWRDLVEKLSGALKGLNLHLPVVELVKTSGKEEFNAAYTRGHAILLPASLAQLPAANSRAAFFLLAHELFHVLSRQDSTMQDELYALLGFKLLNGFEYPAELQATRGSNPDAFDYLHVLQVRTASGDADVVPLVQTSRPLAEVVRLINFFDALDIVLLSVDPAMGQAKRTANGDLQKFSFTNTNWAPLMMRNTSYIIHPEEVLADNFATLMEWRADGALPARTPSGDPINDSALLTSIRDILAKGCEP